MDQENLNYNDDTKGRFMTTDQITITPAAAFRILDLLRQEEDLNQRLRISVSGGGCSGFQYHFLFDDAQLPDDHIFELNGAFVVIDLISLGLLKGSELDYVEDLSGSSFVLKNPNAASSCGCGNSFSL